MARLSPSVPGVVSKVLTNRFASVRAGQTLIELSDTQSAQSLKQEEINLDATRLQVTQAVDLLDFLKSQAARYRQLLSEGLIAAAALDESLSNVRKQQLEVQILNKRMEADQVSIEKIRQQLAGMRIVAPINGIVTDISVTPGQFVAPGGTGDQAATLLTITDLTDLFVQLSVDEIDVTRLEPSKLIELKIDALPGKTARGKIILVAKAPTQQNGKPGVVYDVEASLIDPPPDLRVGMSIFSSIRPATNSPRYLPPEAIVYEGSATSVWIIEQGKVYKRTVEVSERTANGVQVSRGLEQGADVICGPDSLLPTLSEGQAVPSLN
jgi:RND family efflux transporter MFP subunit